MLEQLFSDFKPELGSDDRFMASLERKLNAVEYIKRMQEAQLRRQRTMMLVVLALALFFQVKSARDQASDAQNLLNDYQKRVDELQRLLEDYNSLSKNFENVGKGYEQALLLFDKMADIRHHLELITKNDKDPESVARLNDVLKKFDNLHG